MRRRLAGRKENSTLRSSEQEIRPGSFPSVVNPKPIGGRGADLFFEGLVDVERELVGGVGSPRNRITQHHTPFGEALRVNRHRQHGRTGANCQRRAERRGGAQPAEKRRPHPAVAGVLIHQHAEDARLAKQCQSGLEAILAVEGRHAQSPAVAVHEIIDKFIVKRLIDRAKARLRHCVNQLRVEFPVADVIDREEHRTPFSDVFADEIEVFDRRDAVDLLVRQGGNFDRAQHICAERGEVPIREPTNLARRHFLPESHSQIFPCEPSVAGQDEP